VIQSCGHGPAHLLIVILLVCGVPLWCVRRIPGLPQPVLAVAEIIIVLARSLFLLEQAGLIGRF
jgi:hypothetical protein